MSSPSLAISPQVRILGLVGSGHMMSHFYSNTLPPLLPLLNSDLGISYTMLGALLSLRGIMSSSMQMPAGFLVDRYGAKMILSIGLAMCAIGTMMTATAVDYWMILAGGIVLGVGNSAFHPADYSILSASMDEGFMGRAFSLHSFSGNLGNAIAPAVLITITAYFNWRVSLMVAGIAGFLILAGLLTQWKYIAEDSVPQGRRKQQAKTAADGEPEQSTWEIVRYIFTSPAILFLFLYYCMNTLASGGLRNFAVAGLVETHTTAATAANAAFTAFLVASAAGVLLGGWLADYTKRHEMIAAVGLAISAGVLVLVGAFSLPVIALVVIFSFAGLTNGLIGPARDMLIRRASPKGAVGKVFGFVFSGQTIGQAVAPLAFGLMIDSGVPAWIFYTSAIFTILCMVVVLISAKHSRVD
ncbi:MAG: MFS transporter [Alphaproteobacteria bacterium]|nr:MFS transporter [Alphaproteobacteria bacterium]